jgi:hypothetical protein
MEHETCENTAFMLVPRSMNHSNGCQNLRSSQSPRFRYDAGEALFPGGKTSLAGKNYVANHNQIKKSRFPELRIFPWRIKCHIQQGCSMNISGVVINNFLPPWWLLVKFWSKCLWRQDPGKAVFFAVLLYPYAALRLTVRSWADCFVWLQWLR